jgi:hypothetical protein
MKGWAPWNYYVKCLLSQTVNLFSGVFFVKKSTKQSPFRASDSHPVKEFPVFIEPKLQSKIHYSSCIVLSQSRIHWGDWCSETAQFQSFHFTIILYIYTGHLCRSVTMYQFVTSMMVFKKMTLKRTFGHGTGSNRRMERIRQLRTEETGNFYSLSDTVKSIKSFTWGAREMQHSLKIQKMQTEFQEEYLKGRINVGNRGIYKIILKHVWRCEIMNLIEIFL